MNRKDFTTEIIENAFNTLTSQENGNTTPIKEITQDTIDKVEDYLKNTYDKRYRLYFHRAITPNKCVVKFAKQYYKVILTDNTFKLQRGHMYKFLKF